MEWSEVVPESQWELGKAGTSFLEAGGHGSPLGTKQVVRVTWAGGITKPGGEEIAEVERAAYRVTMSFGDEGETELVPFAIGDLGDGDNNHELCLDRAGLPMRVDVTAPTRSYRWCQSWSGLNGIYAETSCSDATI